MTLAEPRTAAPGLDRDAEDLHRALEELIRSVQFRDRDRICCHGITVSQCYALETIVQRGPATLNELAAALRIDKSTASRAVDSLVDKGLVSRAPHPADGRAVQLEATGAGRRLFGTIEQALVGEARELLAELDPDVRQATVRLVARLARSASRRTEGDACCGAG